MVFIISARILWPVRYSLLVRIVFAVLPILHSPLIIAGAHNILLLAAISCRSLAGPLILTQPLIIDGALILAGRLLWLACLLFSS